MVRLEQSDRDIRVQAVRSGTAQVHPEEKKYMAGAPKGLTTTQLVVALCAFASACVGAGLYLGGLKSEIVAARSEQSRMNGTLERLERDLASRQNPLSLMNEVANVGRRVDTLDHSLFDLIVRLHPGKEALISRSERDYHRRAAPPKVLGLVLPITPAPNPAAVYIHPSSVVPNMFALTLPPEHLGKTVEVLAMRGGQVLSVMPDPNAAGRKVVDIASEFGYRQRYANLDDVIVAAGSLVEQEATIGHATPTPDACVRIGILDPQGNFIDPRLFLPPVKDGPAPPAK